MAKVKFENPKYGWYFSHVNTIKIRIIMWVLLSHKGIGPCDFYAPLPTPDNWRQLSSI